MDKNSDDISVIEEYGNELESSPDQAAEKI